MTLDLKFRVDTFPEDWTLDEVTERLEARLEGEELVHSSSGRLIFELLRLHAAGMLRGVEIHGTEARANADPDNWIFADFDRIFRRAKEALELEAEGYDLFGHSVGGQILHRLAIFYPGTRANRVLAANSGWYTVPSFEASFPYGLADTGVTDEDLAAAFDENLVAFLGEEDDADETRGSLRRIAGAEVQGAHRLARGRYFFERAGETAQRLALELDWRLEVVPGIGHDYRRMSEAAAEYLYGEIR